MGGEKTSMPQWTAVYLGSPPHGRGKELPFVGLEPHTGITPAWAGKSQLSGKQLRYEEDHPRMGGEKLLKCRSSTSRTGSPPHGRGKVADGLLAGACPGITPAWAGKSFINFSFFSALMGSPPHGRGKGYIFATACVLIGITPAWAGKSFSISFLSMGVMDHPRMGGEKTKKIP